MNFAEPKGRIMAQTNIIATQIEQYGSLEEQKYFFENYANFARFLTFSEEV